MISILPKHLIYHTYSYLPIADIGNIMQVNKQNNSIKDSNVMWRLLLKRDFSDNCKETTMIFYKEHHCYIYDTIKDLKIVEYGGFLSLLVPIHEQIRQIQENITIIQTIIINNNFDKCVEKVLQKLKSLGKISSYDRLNSFVPKVTTDEDNVLYNKAMEILRIDVK